VNLPAIPEPRRVRLASLVDNMAAVAAWIDHANDIDDVLEAQAQLEALDNYLEKRHPDYLDPVRRTARLSDIRIGVLLGPAKMGESSHGTLSVTAVTLNTRHRVQFRRMAAYRDLVTTAGAVSRAQAIELIEKARRAPHDAAMYRWRAARDAIDPASTPAADVNADRTGDGWALYCGDFAHRLAHLESAIDLIITDPPYNDASIDLYRQLVGWAGRALCRGGVLITYAGTLRLPEVFQALDGPLEYVWTIALDMRSGSIARVFHKNMLQAWKPLIVMCRREWRAPPWGWDLLISPGRAKDGHLWQQNGGPARELIERYSQPGWVVADPFLGAGTTGRASIELGRQFIGCDVDPRCVEGFAS
jgi:hypothetical protein